MRKFLQRQLRGPILKLNARFGSRPDKARVHEALSDLHINLVEKPGKRGPVINFNPGTDRFIILSDQHKGAKNGADDFSFAENNYLAALQHYNNQQFHYIALGDCEELWENSLAEVIKHNEPSFAVEKEFLRRNAFTKVFGNHDLYWDNDPFAAAQLQSIYGQTVPIYEGVILQTSINGIALQLFCTHGHQGDKMSDGNTLSKWFVANVWAKFQGYLRINPNTPAYDTQLKSIHNLIMYEWSAQQANLLLVTGHTHQPVFESLTYLERLYRLLSEGKAKKDDELAKKLEAEIAQRRRVGETLPDFTAYQPCYFNSGCCCFDDGDITGLEIEKGLIRLVKWKYIAEKSTRILLEEISLEQCIAQTLTVTP